MALTLWKRTMLLCAAVSGAHGFFAAGGLPVLARQSAPPTACALCAVPISKVGDSIKALTYIIFCVAIYISTLRRESTQTPFDPQTAD